MGKKDAFIDKNKAITFKLSYRDSEDPVYQNSNDQNINVDRVFQLKQMPNMESLSQDEQKKLSSLLSAFTDKDQGKFNKQKKSQSENQSKFYIPPEIREKLGSNQLWIDQLRKQEVKQNNQYEDDEYEVEELQEIDEDEENINTEDEEFDEDDYSQNEDDEEYDEDEGQEQKEEKKEQKFPDLECKEFPGFKYESEYQKQITEQNVIPKYDKLVFAKSVKLKKFNEYGLPLNDGYDYSKHFVQPKQQNQGVVEAVFYADYKQAPKLKEDIDYDYNEMTEEQKEVFEALNYDGDDDAYEQLEDDFVLKAQEGEKAIVIDKQEEEEQQQKQKKKKKAKKVHFTIDENGQMAIYDKSQQQQQQQNKQIQQKQQQQQQQLQKQQEEQQNQQEDWTDDEEFDDEEFDDYEFDEEQEEQQQQTKEQPKYIKGNELESILDEHIQEMEHRGDNNKTKPNRVKIVEFEEKQKERFQEYEQYANKEEIVTRQIIPRLTIEQDIALQNYLKRNENGEEELPASAFEKPQSEFTIDITIATKEFSLSKVHENLNIIEEENKKKSRIQPKVQTIEEDQENSSEGENSENEEQSEKNEKSNNQDIDPLKLKAYQLSQSREKNETEEEKKQRKEQLKLFKQARKAKKQIFKQGFEEFTKQQTKQNKQHINHKTVSNIKGISIMPMI